MCVFVQAPATTSLDRLPFFVFVFILKRHPTGIFSTSSYSQFISSLFGCGRKVVQRCRWMCMLSVSC